MEQRAELSEDSQDDDDDALMGDEVLIRARTQLVSKFPMYNFKEVKRDADVYGEVINPDEYRIKEEVDETVAMAEDEEAVAQQEKKPPSKVHTETVKLEIKSRVKFIDYEGRSDGRSGVKVIAGLKPRKVILVRGTDQNKQALAREIQGALKDTQFPVVSPLNGQCVDITSEDTHIFRVSLKDTFTGSLDFAKVGEYEVAYAEGQVRIDYAQSSLPVLRAAPVKLSQGHSAVLLGNLTFRDLTSVLMKQGIRAELVKVRRADNKGVDYVVVCNDGVVSIRKGENNTQIHINGCLCEDYYRIRKMLYGLYEII